MMLKVDSINTYYETSHILFDVSLFIEEGEVVCLLGRNGAGKSTTLKSIIGLVPPRNGSIHFKGGEILGKKPFQICRKGLGFVPEDRRMFSNLSVEDNLLVVPEKKNSKWTLEKIYDVFPKLKELKNSKSMFLSGGEQQMLTIARTLMGSPDLLLLDEPSEGLAPVIVQDLRRLFKKIKKETTILLSEQNSKFALDLSDRSYIIEKGKILHESSVEELCRNPELHEKYLCL